MRHKFDISDKIGYDFPKFDANYKFKNTPIIDGGSDLHKHAVVYQLWGADQYSPYMYFSILSNILYTDILDTSDLYIFVAEHLYTLTVERFSWLDSNCIIPVRYSMALKYMITANPALTRYTHITVVDCDYFFYNDKKTDFYKNVIEFLDTKEKPLAMLTDISAKDTFYSRKEDLCKPVKKENYVDFLAWSSGNTAENIHKWIETSDWHLSCFFAYKNEWFINHPEYYRHALINCNMDNYCDETVWWSWLKAKYDMLPADIEKDFEVKVVLSEPFRMKMVDEKKPGQFLGVHCIVGENIQDEGVLDLIALIRQDFKQNYMQIQEKYFQKENAPEDEGA